MTARRTSDQSRRQPAGAQGHASVPPPVQQTPAPHLAERRRLRDSEGEGAPQEFTPDIDHAGLDIALPGEDRAPAEAAEEHTDFPSDEGELRQE